MAQSDIRCRSVDHGLEGPHVIVMSRLVNLSILILVFLNLKSLCKVLRTAAQSLLDVGC